MQGDAVHNAALAALAKELPKPRRLRPLRDLILVEVLDMGRERTTKGGIVIPATVGNRAKTRADIFRGKVLALGPDAKELEVGEHVLVYTYADGDGSQLITGTAIGGHRRLVKPDDIVCSVDADAEVGW